MVFEARDSTTDEATAKHLDRVCPVRRKPELKVNAQVLLMKVRPKHALARGPSPPLLTAARPSVLRH